MKGLIAFGIVTILLAIPLGNIVAEIYLWFSGGMDTDRYLICIEAFINGFQILGGISTGLGGLSAVLKAAEKHRG